MYKILGADQKEYGPASADQLRQWIAEGRAKAQTLVVSEGGGEWRPLGSLPEFALALSGGRVASPQPPAPPRTNGMALTSLVMGLLAITVGLCCCYGIPFNILGVVFSLVALSQISADPQNQTGRGLAITGLILSSLTFLLGLGLLVFTLAAGGMESVFREMNKF